MEKKNTSGLLSFRTEKWKSVYSPFNAAPIFKIASIVSGAIGFIAGIVMGNILKIKVITYEYPSVEVGEKMVEQFNMGAMFGTWIAFATIALIFLGIYAHLINQETTIVLLNNFAKLHFNNQDEPQIEAENSTTTTATN